MSTATVESYAPYELVSDAASLGLATTTVSSALGTCVARHPARRRSTRATLFLHGAAGSWTTWTPLLQAAVTDRIDLGDIVVFDLPGWGDARLAEGPLDDPIHAICSLVKDMAEELGYTEWDLVGHSSAASSPCTWPRSGPRPCCQLVWFRARHSQSSTVWSTRCDGSESSRLHHAVAGDAVSCHARCRRAGSGARNRRDRTAAAGDLSPFSPLAGGASVAGSCVGGRDPSPLILDGRTRDPGLRRRDSLGHNRMPSTRDQRRP